MKTYSQKPADVTRRWYIVDASGATLGRMATAIATKLTGKDKPSFTPHVDAGDYVIVINAKKVKVTGNKYTQKQYYSHSGHAGGLKTKIFEQEIAVHPERVVAHAVEGMIPDNKLKNERMKRLKIFTGNEHPHDPQKPQELKV